MSIETQSAEKSRRELSDDELRAALVKSWDSPLVPRTRVEDFSGGLLRAGTLANLDCAGEGPDRIIVAGRVAYLRDSLIDLLLKRRSPSRPKVERRDQ
jgi:hypothetical protein